MKKKDDNKTKSQMTGDGIESLTHRIGDPSRDKAASVYFGQKVIPDQQLIAAYESNWLARNIVDIPVMDALRKGWRWQGDKHLQIEEEERRLNVAGKMMKAFKKGRLLGGGALFMGTDQDPSQPLDVEKIPKGGLKFLTVLTRLQLNAGEIDLNPQSEHYGEPKDYNISTPTEQLTIHPSHLVLFNGDERSDNIYNSGSTGWPGMSVIQATHDAIANSQGAMSSVASLIYEANIDVLKIPDFMDNIATKQGESELLQRIRLASLSKGINGMLVIDASETLERRSASFSNFSSLLETFAVFVAASGQIPATRFLAQSPSGLVSTGESDMKNYYDLVGSKQKLELNPATAKLFIAIRRSATGINEPIERTWAPLEEMNEEELAAIGLKITETIVKAVEGQILHEDEGRALLIDKLQEVGSFSGIEEIVNKALGAPELEDDDEDDPESQAD